MYKEHIVRIGSRASRLAMSQAKGIVTLLKAKYPRYRFRIIRIKTLGDELRSVELFKSNQIGFFTKEIEKALLQRRIDIAVHSLKDLPTCLAEGTVLACVPKRLDSRDVLVTRDGRSLKNLRLGARVGTASVRRKIQLLIARPDLKVMDLRGNMDTRLSKVLKVGSLDAIVLAQAGLSRLKFSKRLYHVIADDVMMPAVGQGALGLQVRMNDTKVASMLKRIEHPSSRLTADCERIFLQTLQGGCRVPVGVRVKLRNKKVFLHGRVFSVKTNKYIECQFICSKKKAVHASEQAARKLLRKGALLYMRQARHV